MKRKIAFVSASFPAQVLTGVADPLYGFCGISVSAASIPLFATLPCLGVITDLFIYHGSNSLGASLLLSHVTALIGPTAIVWTAASFYYPGKTIKLKILEKPFPLFSLFLLFIVRTGVSVFARTIPWNPPLTWLPAVAATVFSASVVALFFSIILPQLEHAA